MFQHLALQVHFTSYTDFTAIKITELFFNQLTEVNDSQKLVKFWLMLVFLVFPMWCFSKSVFSTCMQQDVWALGYMDLVSNISTRGLYGSKRVV